MGISTSRLCERRADRGRIDGEYRMRAPSVASRSRTRGWRTATRADPGHDLAFRKMAVAHHALLARLGLQIGMLCEKLSNLRFDGLGQQRTRPAGQDLCEGIGKGPWLGELDDVTVRHGVSLLHWRSGGVEHHHDTPPYPVTPSPTSGHSSVLGLRGDSAQQCIGELASDGRADLRYPPSWPQAIEPCHQRV